MKYRAVAHAECQYADRKQCNRHPRDARHLEQRPACRGRRRRSFRHECDREISGDYDREQNRQRADAADAVGDQAADRPEAGAKCDDQRHEETRCHAGHMILNREIERQRVGKADEAAEGDEVEEHEPAAVGIAQQRAVGL